MGLISNWIREMGDTWDRMAEGEPEAFIGLPGREKGSGSDCASTPDGNELTERQEQMLMRFFHQQYSRYPVSEFEFQQWLRDNW